jgi:very-short-patch-repair endonuclease
MSDPIALIRAHGGLVATHELYASGYDRASLAGLVRRRQLVRVRQGWFCAPGTDPVLLRAARVGGVATCRTALRQIGVWVDPDIRLHVAVPRHAVRLRAARSPLLRRRDAGDADTIVHWRDVRTLSRLLIDPVEALIDLARCAPLDELAAAADSLLHQHPALRPQLVAASRRLPQSAREAVIDADGTCESGIETIVWRLLRRRGIAARRQVAISGVGRVDFVVGRRLVIEVDGEEYHTDPVAFERDRRRDAQLAMAGYVTLRFSYRQVCDHLDIVEGAILAAIARGHADE